MRKGKKISLSIPIGLAAIVIVFLGWFLSGIFEGENPEVALQPLPKFISGSQEFTLSVSDMKRGLKILKVSLSQGEREIIILERTFEFRGLLNRDGSHKDDARFSIDPSELNLSQGRADLLVRVWDYSRRRGGDGNLSHVQHKMTVDTIPPAIRAISRMHYVNVGGTGLVVYQTSSDSIRSGLFVNDLFFPGFQADEGSHEGRHVCYFAIPHDTKGRTDLYLWAEDRAGNNSVATFYYHIRRKRFMAERITITDRFLRRLLPSFSFYFLGAKDSEIDKFLRINRDLRQENAETLYNLRTETNPEQLWRGTWMRLKNAANMAGFGDRRLYYYKGEKVDEQVHLGIDLASLSNAEVQAGNHGRVIFAGRLGIYGLTAVLDQGQGLASVYSHLSKIDVVLDQEVMKGEVIGLTGQTGLAGGDHLHFGIMVSGVFVNPLEWWDSHWIQDNITRKLVLLNK